MCIRDSMLISASERRRNLYNLCTEDNSFDVANMFRYLGNMTDNEGSAHKNDDTWLDRSRKWWGGGISS